MATFLFGNGVKAMVQLEIKWQVEQRQISYPVSGLDSCYGPPWHCRNILQHLILLEVAVTAAGTHLFTNGYVFTTILIMQNHEHNLLFLILAL